MVKPPAPGDASYDKYTSERNAIIQSLTTRSQGLSKTLNSLENYSCNSADGAMYVFPSVKLPPKAIAAAEEAGLNPDDYYAEQLLLSTGICVVPGSGFGQAEGTFHFRTTFLPQEDKMNTVADSFQTFNATFMEKYRE